MRGASGHSLAAAVERVEPLLSGPEAGRLGEELFQVASLLDGSVALRRALTDPSREGEAKADLVVRLLGAQVSGTTVDIASTYAGQTSITTLGTVATGTWSGTAIAVNKGGTGATDAATARANLSAAGKYAATLGALVAGTATTITHNLGTTDVIAGFRRVSDGSMEELSWAVVDANNITVTADMAYAASALRVVVIG